VKLGCQKVNKHDNCKSPYSAKLHYVPYKYLPLLPEVRCDKLISFIFILPVTLINLDDWLTVHRSITLFNFQLDAQNSYLFIYNTFIKILYMFRALPCSSSGGLLRNRIYEASGIVTLCR